MHGVKVFNRLEVDYGGSDIESYAVAPHGRAVLVTVELSKNLGAEGEDEAVAAVQRRLQRSGRIIGLREHATTAFPVSAHAATSSR